MNLDPSKPDALSRARLAIGLAAMMLIATPAMAKDRSAPAVALDPAGWITAADYPAAAISAGAEGVSGIRWDVTADGRAENCTVTATSGSPELDQAACQAIVAHARYTPALDRKGRPVRESAARRVRWQLPVAQPATTVPYTLRPF